MLARRALWLIALVPTLSLVNAGDKTPASLPGAGRLNSVARPVIGADVRKQLGLAPEYETIREVENLKIAVLDFGFDGIDGTRPYLPADTVLVEHYEPEFVRKHNLGDPEFRKGFAPGNKHGRIMAQIVWGVTGQNPRGPKFYLLNANGPTMLQRAVRFAIKEKVDLILFCNTLDGGGNGDGRGPINRIVQDAISAGIIWINAAGNHGRRVYRGPVEVLDSGYLRLGSQRDASGLRFRNLLDDNSITVTLTWNDYGEAEDEGTTMDLDLFVEDWQGNVIATSELRQVAGAEKTADGETRNPRERLVLRGLAADREHDYRIRIRHRAGQFAADARVRVLVSASRDGTMPNPKTGKDQDVFQFLDASNSGEIYPPADHTLVLTVGDAGTASSIGPTMDHRVKPDVILRHSEAVFTDGEVSTGSSNAAAYFTGIVALLKAAEPRLEVRHLLDLARHSQTRSASTTVYRVPTTSALRPVRDYIIQRRLWRTPTRSELSAAVGTSTAAAPSKQR
jgi:hypothetical protein